MKASERKNHHGWTKEQKFWHYVLKTDGCWFWSGSTNGGRYGKITIDYKYISAHRVSYELHKGKIPKGLYVCHSCDNPRCVNPDHLFLGTPKQNQQDMRQKGRGLNGEDHPRSKLKLKDVQFIKKHYVKGSTKGWTTLALAKKFGVSRSAIYNIVLRNRTWKEN